jgi:excisionase family DNA binding protein
MSAKNQAISPTSTRPLLGFDDIVERTGLSDSKIHRDIRAKKLACLRFGRSLRFTEEAYEDYLRRHQQGKP